MKIDFKVADSITQGLQDLMTEHLSRMDKAFQAEDELTLSFPVKLMKAKDGIKVSTGIAFVESKVKDSSSTLVKEEQLLK